ncbi:MAG: hypothetical protein R3F59_21565, partial [Myxococcota bacterium]
MEDPLAHDDDLTPRERRRRKAGLAEPLEEGFDEVGASDPEDLLGPVDEFTLSLSEEVVAAAMASTSASRPAVGAVPVEAVPVRAAAAESVPASSFAKPTDPRFARSRPGSRSLPAPRPAPQALDPLTTGVVPGGGGVSAAEFRDLRPPKPGQQAPGQHTSELMLDGLDEAPREPDQWRGGRGGDNPRSERLPEVPMPQEDTARA